MVFQDFRLVPHLSAFDNIALPLRIAGITEKDLQGPVTEMLSWIGLSERAEARPATLSGGEQQRVAIARAVIGRPEILVADEPTGNVDPEMAVRLLQLFAALNRLGTTVVVATHDIHLLQEIEGAQMMRLEKGRLSDPTGSLKHPAAPVDIEKLIMAAPFAFAIPAHDRKLIPDGRFSGTMSWVMAIMLFLTLLAAAAAISLGNAAKPRQRRVGQRSDGATARSRSSERARDSRNPSPICSASATGVTAVDVVPEAESRKLLEPWLGDAGGRRRYSGSRLDRCRLCTARLRLQQLRQIQQNLRRVSRQRARIDSHASWMAPFVALMQTLFLLALAVHAATVAGDGGDGRAIGTRRAEHASDDDRDYAHDGIHRCAGGTAVSAARRTGCACSAGLLACSPRCWCYGFSAAVSPHWSRGCLPMRDCRSMDGCCWY